MNSGFILLMVASVISLIVLSIILALAAKVTDKVKKWKAKIDRILYWNSIIRLLLELSLELSIICLMDIAIHNFSNWGYTVSFTLSVLSIFGLVGFAFWIRFYLKKKDLKSKILQDRVGSAYDSLKPNASSLIITEWFIYRRLIYAAAAFFGQGQLWLQF